MPHLTVMNGVNRGRMVAVTPGFPFRIGRDPSLELSIDDVKASRTHVEIHCDGEQFVLNDLRSKNGTLVNGSPVDTHPLKDRDEIRIGETLMLFSMQDLPRPELRNNHDSQAVALRPMGALPTLGTGGNSESGSTEGFETLDLEAPLNLLRTKSADQALLEQEPGERVDLPAHLERANRSLRTLYEIGRACAGSRSAQDLFRALSEGLMTALEADRVSPILLEEGKRWRVVEPAEGEGGEEKKRVSGRRATAITRISVSKTIVDYALQTRRSVLTAPRKDERFGQARSVGEQGITSALCVPILCDDQLLGLIYADRLGGEDFDRQDQELLTAACLQAAPALAKLLRLQEALERKDQLLRELKGQYCILGESPPMQALFSFIERAAPTQSVVLVLGESGTGKELVARAIHYQSSRKENPLVMVNCAALTESLIESELFGHAKGAFTGATADRKGRFEMAHEGTIFLDEVGELSLHCQTKLLRVLEQGEISRVGEARVRKVNVRLVAATNRDLAAEAAAGNFREDLFYRLNVLSVALPPLRQRGPDIALLLRHFLAEAAARCGRPCPGFSEEALERLASYGWPGNVRELRNLTERLAVLCPNEVIGVPDLPEEFRRARGPGAAAVQAGVAGAPGAEGGEAAAPGAGLAGLSTLAEAEKVHILKVLGACGGNKKQAAEVLGIDRSTLYAKLRIYGA